MTNHNILDNFTDLKRAWQVKATLPIEFSIHYSSNIFSTINRDLLEYSTSDRRIVVIDRNVHLLYSTQLEAYFKNANIELKVLIVDITEGDKNWGSADKILNFFENNGILRRSEPVIAIGGGVLLDLVGFCTSVYRRGIPYIKVPTTLLAIVDASVGTKVGINHFDRRNRLGAYYPPIATLVDKKFINTQHTSEIINGLSEIFKLALIKDNELFQLLETNYTQLITEKFQYGAVPVRVINLAISGMISELMPNLWEKKLDRCVDFGHSFSPMIEMKNVQTLCHGSAVAVDCIFSSCISYIRGLISEETLNRIFTTATNLQLLTYHEDFTNVNLLLKSLADTMKHRDNNQYVPVPTSIGDYTILNDITDDELVASVNVFKVLNNG